ncbi:hypothetical protein GCM10010317_064900 [Streptomyces mirabilis]|nr:hypothetical protein GCM10010317_064900 [Streptomyces mirabilis]
MASAGVTPIPADKSSTGLSPWARQKVPRGAVASNRSPTRMWARNSLLAAPYGSTLTLMRYAPAAGRPDSE